jgi:hypothetical protein
MVEQMIESNLIQNLILLRCTVGFLGEKDQFNWWSSSFLNESTKKMLAFTFPRSTHIAQYEGVSAAAAKIHDESIGVGKSFHIFRLPEFLEQNLWNDIQSKVLQDEIDTITGSKEKALESLVKLAGKSKTKGEGPVNIGEISNDEWEESISKIASAYLKAFNANQRAYPYLEMSQSNE